MGSDLCVVNMGGDTAAFGCRHGVFGPKRAPVTEAFEAHKDHVVTEMAAGNFEAGI
jgi:hypothetical protein